MEEAKMVDRACDHLHCSGSSEPDQHPKNPKESLSFRPVWQAQVNAKISRYNSPERERETNKKQKTKKKRKILKDKTQCKKKN
jgi:hypothetical protein